jgi:hypothetical protein
MNTASFSLWIRAISIGFLAQGLGIIAILGGTMLSGVRAPIAACIVLVLSWSVFRASATRVPLGGDIGAMAMFVVALLVGWMIGGADEYGTWKLGAWLSMAFVPYAVLRLWVYRDISAALPVLYSLLAFVFINLVVVVTYIVDQGVEYTRWRMIKDGVDVIGISRSFGLGLLLLLWILLQGRGVYRMITVMSLMAVLALPQFLIGERGPVLAGILACLYLIITYRVISPRSTWIMFVVIFLAAIGAVVGQTEVVNTVASRMSSDVMATDGRVSILQTAFEVAKGMNPVYGVGLGQFSYEGSATGTRQYAHNIFIEIYLELGALGIVAFLWFIGTVISRGFIAQKPLFDDSVNHVVIICRTLFVYSMMNALVSGDIATNHMIWVSAGLLLAACHSRAAHEKQDRCINVV